MIKPLAPHGSDGLVLKAPKRVTVGILTANRSGGSYLEQYGQLIGPPPTIAVGSEESSLGAYGAFAPGTAASSHLINCVKNTYHYLASGAPVGTANTNEVYNNTDIGPGSPEVFAPTPPAAYTDVYVQRQASIADCQYKFTVILPCAWKSEWGGITIPYRIWTVNQTSYQLNPYFGGADSQSETATQTYTDMVATIDLSDGDTTGESDVFTLAAGGYGDTITVVGSGDVADLHLQGAGADIFFNYDTLVLTNSKTGFAPYWRTPEDTSNPIPCYQSETATTATAPAGQPPYPTYSGSEVWSLDGTTNPYTGIPNYQLTNSLTDNVPLVYRSTTADVIDPALVSKEAVSATSTRIQWPEGLVMTLGNPQSTASMKDPVDAYFAARSWDDATPLGSDNAPAIGPISRRFLPPSELTYDARKGRYCIAANGALSFSLGVESLIGNDPPISTDESLEISWNRVSVNLDTGVRSPEGMSDALILDGSDGSLGFGVIPPTAIYQEPPPDDNTMIILDSLAVAGTAPSLRLGFFGIVGS